MNNNETNKIYTASHSVTGLSHIQSGLECQDDKFVHMSKDGSRLCAVIADGLGSKEYSREAAKAVVKAAALYLWKVADLLNVNNAAQILQEPLLKEAKDAVARISQERPMDCNLAFLLINDGYAYIGHLGDCAVCVLDHEPRARTTQGATANATLTVLTANPEDVKVEAIPMTDSLNGFILTTDGLEGEIYRKSSGWINKVTEGYYNSVVHAVNEEDANARLEKRIAALQKLRGDFFSDDISIIVVSCNGKPIQLEEDLSWRCTCGNRNPINAPYCLTCDRDRLQIYPYDKLREWKERPQCRALLGDVELDLDNFVYRLAKDPQMEYLYLAEAANRLGVAPPKAPPVPRSEPTPKPAAEPKPEPVQNSFQQPRTPKPKSSRGGDHRPAEGHGKLSEDEGSNLTLGVEAYVGSQKTAESAPESVPEPAPVSKAVKMHSKRVTALIVAGIVMAVAATIGMLLGIRSISGGEDNTPELSGLDKGYLGEKQAGTANGVGVESDGSYLWAAIYEDGEATEERLRIDRIGIMGPDGKYVYTWDGELGDPSGDEYPVETTGPMETVLPGTTVPTETEEPVYTTNPTEPDDIIRYPAGTAFRVLQSLKRGNQDPYQTMTVPLDLKAGDIVKTLGDPIEKVDGIRWIRIETRNGDIGWVDIEYLEQIEQP